MRLCLKEALNMRYYLYISDVKVDMLRAQISQEKLKPIAASLKIDLKVLSLSLDRKPNPEDLYAKLQVVEKYLENNEQIGTQVRPKSYFRGSAKMTSGVIRNSQGEYVYFGGYAGKMRRAIGLVGSPHHLIGGTIDMEDIVSRMASKYLLPMITSCLRANVTLDSDNAESQMSKLNNLAFYIRSINSASGAPLQRLEYVAKRLSMGDDYILATPLYVALAE